MSNAKLPAYFDYGFGAVMKEAQKRDQTHAHYWIKITKDGSNEQVRAAMGWEPCDDPEVIKTLGLEHLAKNSPTGRPRFMDVELWRMPREMQAAIHEVIDQRISERNRSVKAGLEAMADEAKGKTKGGVNTFISTGDEAGVVDREAVVAPTVTRQ